MNNDRELLQQALDALDKYGFAMLEDERHWQTFRRTIEALRARLAQPEQKPVAWMHIPHDDKLEIVFTRIKFNHKIYKSITPVYTAPPQRDFKFSTIEEAMQPMLTPTGQPHLTDDEGRFATAFTALIKAGYGKEADIVLKCKPAWQGLTDEEIKKLHHVIDWTNAHTYVNFARAIEAALKAKNGYSHD